MTTAGPRNVASAVVVKAGDVFILSQSTGEIPCGNQDGYGIYFHDCRYLEGYELKLSGTPPNPLGAGTERTASAHFELTNNPLPEKGHSEKVKPQTFGITLARVIDEHSCTVQDVYTVENYDVREHRLALSFRFEAKFEDIFQIRGLHPRKEGRNKTPKWQDNALVLSYAGADGVTRRLEVHPGGKPDKRSRTGMAFELTLGAGEKRDIKLSFHIVESRQPAHKPVSQQVDAASLQDQSERRTKDWLGSHAEIQSDSALLDRVISRSLRDLGMLKSTLDDYQFFSAGLPWYGALFGRDSIIAALQTLAFNPDMAEQTLQLLAQYQGTKEDDWRDEEPGKILHELRRGELANLDEIPQTPYYGSVDSTPLFLILMGEHANWTGSLELFYKLQSHVDAALRWIDQYGMRHGHYVWYASKSKGGLNNQGWKDSGDAIMNADGSLATPPIALAEVQGYIYRAKLLIADLYARSGNQHRANQLRLQAQELKTNFNRDFWIEDKQFYAIALQKHGRPAAVISSNPGQALWTDIVDENRAAAVVRQLMADHMFSGWGIRTLSRQERRFNPMGYHLGTVWPHDNSLIMAGLREHGFDDESLRVLDGILNAAEHFLHFRLPEVFAGFAKTTFEDPVRYPVACHPQAWAAGAVPFMAATLLGLHADGFNRRLRIVRPVLPTGVKQLAFRRIKFAGSSLDLEFHRGRDGSVQREVTHNPGNIAVVTDDEAGRRAA